MCVCVCGWGGAAGRSALLIYQMQGLSTNDAWQECGYAPWLDDASTFLDAEVKKQEQWFVEHLDVPIGLFEWTATAHSLLPLSEICVHQLASRKWLPLKCSPLLEKKRRRNAPVIANFIGSRIPYSVLEFDGSRLRQFEMCALPHSMLRLPLECFSNVEVSISLPTMGIYGYAAYFSDIGIIRCTDVRSTVDIVLFLNGRNSCWC